jgi:hypothetical protein
MPFSDSPEPLFTPSMLDALLARWSSLPGHDASVGSEHSSPAQRMNQARDILRATLDDLLPCLSPGDQALYARLLAARELHAWRTHFFDCFDLMARTRGAAIAVLRLHALYSLLRDTEPVSTRSSAVERPFALAYP